MLAASDGTSNDDLGTSCDIDGNWAVAGAPRADNPTSSEGAAYVFKRTGTFPFALWNEHGKLTASDAAPLDSLNEFYDDMSNWIGEGKIKWRETVFEGTEYAPKASCLSLREKILEKC
jgi:hypothetical protein